MALLQLVQVMQAEVIQGRPAASAALWLARSGGVEPLARRCYARVKEGQKVMLPCHPLCQRHHHDWIEAFLVQHHQTIGAAALQRA